MSKKDPVIENAFISNYLINGRNGTQAYIKASPGVTVKSASVLATKMLARVSVIDAINKGLNDAEDKSLPTRPEVLKRLDNISKKAEDDKQYGSSVNAMREYGKISGMYEESDDGKGYVTFIQSLIEVNAPVQINIEQKKEES